MSEKSSLLSPSCHPLLNGIDFALWQELIDSGLCTVRTLNAGEEIYSPQSDSNGLGILLVGSATAYTPHPIKKVMLRDFTAGAVFGIADWYGEEQACFSRIEAQRVSQMLLIKPMAVRRLLAESPAFREHYISFLTGRIRFLNQKIGYLTAGSAEFKLSHYLLSLGECETVELPISMSSLAEMLDLGRASLYRAFDTLTQDGFISKQGKTITLHNRAGMAQYYHQKTTAKETKS